MLLYDRLREHAERQDSKRLLSPQNQRRLACLRKAGQAVYELTDVVPLFTTWEQEKEKRVPRRPPACPMWAEWRFVYEDGDGISWDWTAGCIVTDTQGGREGALSMVKANRPESEHMKAVMDAADEFYTTHMFRCLNTPFSGVPPALQNHPQLAAARTVVANKAVLADQNYMVWALADAATKIDAMAVVSKYNELKPGVLEMDWNDDWNVLNCSGCAGLMRQLADPAWCAWPAFMAFALLHCQNVEGVRNVPEEHTQRECRKHGRPPRTEWRTLSVRVPRLKRARGGAGDGEGSPRRFHLRSGHFKNLTHPRYHGHDAPGGNWHWWPACWAGDPALGTLHTTRKLQT